MPLDSAVDRDRRERYRRVYQEEGVYVPLFAQPWYMDAVCGEQSWSAWMCEHDGAVFAAMPYYLDESNGLRRITKAPLAQINGSEGRKNTALMESKSFAILILICSIMLLLFNQILIKAVLAVQKNPERYSRRRRRSALPCCHSHREHQPPEFQPHAHP